MLHLAVSDIFLNLRTQVGGSPWSTPPARKAYLPNEMCWLKNACRITHKVERHKSSIRGS